MQHTNAFLKVVEEAKNAIRETDVDTIAARMEAGEEFVLIDVREDREWANGHIKGAIHLGKGVIERDIERTIGDPATELVLYCGGGFRSALAAEVLQRMGYTNVSSMDGGWRVWNERGFPVES
jgi:rhodanese-related sulfurtransferase